MTTLTTRRRLYELLSPDDRDTTASNWVNYFLITLILANLLAVSLQTIGPLEQRYSKEFLCFEIFSVVVFSVEFLARIWAAPEAHDYQNRTRFLGRFDSVVDILSILPLYLSLLFGFELRAFIALRLLRLLKLVRYFSPLLMLAQVVKAEARAFFAAIFVLLILVFVAASGIYFFERHVQPEDFGSIPAAMWWATVTLTTLGYGDIVPMTIGGKFFAALMTILSVGTVALPAGMLASRFSEELHRRKHSYSELVLALRADGNLNSQDMESLEQARESLCLTETDAKDIEYSVAQVNSCPHCKGTGKIPAE
ncbi:MAG: ion transporter [Pseudomonadota bacterium]